MAAGQMRTVEAMSRHMPRTHRLPFPEYSPLTCQCLTASNHSHGCVPPEAQFISAFEKQAVLLIAFFCTLHTR
jgi:hypothetical protein